MDGYSKILDAWQEQPRHELRKQVFTQLPASAYPVSFDEWGQNLAYLLKTPASRLKSWLEK